MPSVSVIIPVCNVERYLRECLQSVFDQTLADIEVICVNDGSTDGSLALLQELAATDGRMRIIDKANAGYGAAVNDGIDASTGEYVTVLDADDLLPADACEAMLAFARDNGDLDFLKADAKVFTGPAGNRVYDYTPASLFKQWYEAPFASREDPGRIRARVGAPGLYKKAFLDELDGWNRPIPKGFLKGFLDLVFRKDGFYYVVDWKSNRLNGQVTDFTAEGVRAEMAKEGYFFQYLLYSVVLHRFLKETMGTNYSWNRNFGGVRYYFLRGIASGGKEPVFADRPSEAVLDKLSAALGLEG